jgi:hypothetical protein
LLAILERVDPKTSGVEELLAPAGVVEAGLASLSSPAAELSDDRELKWEGDEWVGWYSPEGTSDSGGSGPSDARHHCLACTAMKSEREGCSFSFLIHRAAA